MGKGAFFYIFIIFSFSCKTASTISTRNVPSSYVNDTTSNSSLSHTQNRDQSLSPSKNCATAEKCLGQNLVNDIQKADKHTLAKLEIKKKNELKEKAHELDDYLTEYQASYKACQENGTALNPLLTNDDIEKIKSLGVENLSQALVLLSGPSPAVSSKSDTSSDKSWYQDQTNWGIFNMLTSVTLIAGSLTTSTKVQPDLLSKFSTHYSDFIANRSYTNRNFKNYLDDNKIKYSPPEITHIESAINSSKGKMLGKKVAKYTTLTFGVGMLISGGIMVAAGLNLTEQGCPANITLIRQLALLKDDVASIKSEISLIQLEKDKAAMAQ